MQVRGNLELSNRARRLSMDAAAASGAAGQNGISGIWIDLTEIRTFTFPFSMIPVPGIALTERARVYPWIGYEQGSDDASDSDRDDEMVYVTDYGSVYHTHADCTHLDLTIIATTTDEVGSLRNDYGEKYRKCDYFPAGYTGTVYVTAKGDRYYPSLKYAGITRHADLWSPGTLDESLIPDGFSFAYDTSTPSCRLNNQPYDPSDTADTQYYVIDGFILSPNVTLETVKTIDEGFADSDHNPVRLTAKLG